MKWNSEADFEMSLSIIGNENPEDFFSISGRSFSKGGTLLPRVVFTAPSEARQVCNRNPREQSPALGNTSVWDGKKIQGTFFHFWCWMELSFGLYRVPLTFEWTKLWPLQPLKPLKKTFLDFYNSALGKNLSYREEKSIFFQSDEKRGFGRFFFFRGEEKQDWK